LLSGLLLEQSLPVSDRDLVIVGMNFGEGQEAVAVSAVIDESGLKRWLYARDLGEIDISPKLFLTRRFVIKFLNPIASYRDHPGFLRMRRIDQHFACHVDCSPPLRP
jgi:hypothetical protein